MPPADDGFIAFNSTVTGKKDIYIVRPDGSELRRIVGGPSTDSQPSWSPDGKKLAFESNRSGSFDIYTIDAAGKIRDVVSGFSAVGRPSWSPDGSRIAFVASLGSTSGVYVANVNSSPKLRRLSGPSVQTTTIQANETQPSWSPDGTRIAYTSNATGNYEVFVAKVSGTLAPKDVSNSPAQDRGPTWAPDSSRIAFASDRGGDYDIYAVGPDGSGLVRLVTNPADDRTPAWSPDGSQLAFTSNRSGNKEIWTQHVAGGVANNLTSDGDAEVPVWSHDGAEIAYVRLSESSSDIVVMESDGTNQTNITSQIEGMADRPDWQPADPVSPDFTPPSGTITTPTDGSTLRASVNLQMSGTSIDPGSGVARVQIAILASLHDGTYRWWNGSRFVARSRQDRLWVSATGTTTWAFWLGLLPRSGSGTRYRVYRAFVRGTDVLWNATTTFTRGKDLVRFQVR